MLAEEEADEESFANFSQEAHFKGENNIYEESREIESTVQ